MIIAKLGRILGFKPRVRQNKARSLQRTIRMIISEKIRKKIRLIIFFYFLFCQLAWSRVENPTASSHLSSLVSGLQEPPKESSPEFQIWARKIQDEVLRLGNDEGVSNIHLTDKSKRSLNQAIKVADAGRIIKICAVVVQIGIAAACTPNPHRAFDPRFGQDTTGAIKIQTIGGK